MTANGRIQININAHGIDGEFFPLYDSGRSGQDAVVADAIVTAVEHSNLSVLELRIVVPSQRAEELMLQMVQGDTEMLIARMSPVVQFE